MLPLAAFVVPTRDLFEKIGEALFAVLPL